MENRKLDPKTIKNMSYSALLGMRESDHPARKIDWPTRAHRYFGIIALPSGEIAGGIFLDNGHSLAGEASVAVHKLLGHNPGSDYNNAIDKSSGMKVIAFPGSGAGFKATGLPYTAKNIEIYSLYLYMTHGYTTGSMMLTTSDPMDDESLASPIQPSSASIGGHGRRK